jgi:hypothetical protein
MKEQKNQDFNKFQRVWKGSLRWCEWEGLVDWESIECKSKEKVKEKDFDKLKKKMMKFWHN